MTYFYLSFCDPERPTGQQFLGCTVVKGNDIVEACKEAWRLKINPGGEVMGFALPFDSPADFPDGTADRINRFISREEVAAAGDEYGPMQTAFRRSGTN